MIIQLGGCIHHLLAHSLTDMPCPVEYMGYSGGRNPSRARDVFNVCHSLSIRFDTRTTHRALRAGSLAASDAMVFVDGALLYAVRDNRITILRGYRYALYR
jgi:hypothetical protein